MTELEQKQFEEACKPLIKFLCESDVCDPHHIVIVDCTSAVLFSGEATVHTEEFLRD